MSFIFNKSIVILLKTHHKNLGEVSFKLFLTAVSDQNSNRKMRTSIRSFSCKICATPGSPVPLIFTLKLHSVGFFRKKFGFQARELGSPHCSSHPLIHEPDTTQLFLQILFIITILGREIKPWWIYNMIFLSSPWGIIFLFFCL